MIYVIPAAEGILKTIFFELSVKASAGFDSNYSIE